MFPIRPIIELPLVDIVDFNPRQPLVRAHAPYNGVNPGNEAVVLKCADLSQGLYNEFFVAVFGSDGITRAPMAHVVVNARLAFNHKFIEDRPLSTTALLNEIRDIHGVYRPLQLVCALVLLYSASISWLLPSASRRAARGT